MRIENNKLVFEVVTCSMCKDGKATRGVHCKNYGKAMRGRPCEICGSRNKHNHKIVSQETVDCMFCDGQGKKLEDRFDRLPDHLVDPLIELITFTFRTPDMRAISLDNRFITACYTPGNSFSGCQDYVDHRNSPADLILDKVLKQVRGGYTHQALNYIDGENNLKLDVQYWGFNGGYTAEWM